MEENYKRATVVVDGEGIDFKIEGNGSFHMGQQHYRLLSMAVNEMLAGHAASCWQDYVPDVGYIRVARAKYLCNVKCKRQGMSAVREVPKSCRITSVVNHPSLNFTLGERLNKFLNKYKRRGVV